MSRFEAEDMTGAAAAAYERFASSDRHTADAVALTRSFLDALRPNVVFGIDVVRDVEPPAATRVGIVGAGLLAIDHRSEVPMLLIDESNVGGSRTAGLGDPSMRRLATDLRRLEIHVPASTVIVALPPPHAQCAAGSEIAAGASRGTLGVRVTRANGRTAALTAGHVARSVGDAVACGSGDALGTVVLSDDPTKHEAHAPSPDVAVIATGRRLAAGDVLVRGTAAVHGGESVTSVGARTTDTTIVQGLLGALWDGTLPGTWGPSFMTAAPVSVRGDSGAPVLLTDSDRLVGHIVAGSSGVTSFIQLIDYILAASGCTLDVAP